MKPRKPLIAGNWKMHTSFADGCELAMRVAAACKENREREVLLAPPFITLPAIAKAVEGSGIIISSQNICWEEKGAFTGEISPQMLQDAGGKAVIVGHSERRQIFFETDAMVNQRLKGGLHHGLLVILCVGESLDAREEGQTFRALESQLKEGLIGIAPDALDHLVIAYEPIWAIGTGKTASPEQAQETHAFIREAIATMYEKNIADAIRILYGGSVKPANIDALMAQPDIDGVLVGGASLDAESFVRIINFT